MTIEGRAGVGSSLIETRLLKKPKKCGIPKTYLTLGKTKQQNCSEKDPQGITILLGNHHQPQVALKRHCHLSASHACKERRMIHRQEETKMFKKVLSEWLVRGEGEDIWGVTEEILLGMERVSGCRIENWGWKERRDPERMLRWESLQPPQAVAGNRPQPLYITKKWRRGGTMPRGAPDILRPAGSLSSDVRLCNKLFEPGPELGLWSEALALVSMLPQLPVGWAGARYLGSLGLRFPSGKVPFTQQELHRP